MGPALKRQVQQEIRWPNAQGNLRGVKREAGKETMAQVKLGFYLATGRQATEAEIRRGVELIGALERQDALEAMVVDDDDRQPQVLGDRGDDLRVEHQVGAVSDHHDNVAVSIREPASPIRADRIATPPSWFESPTDWGRG